MLVANSVTVTLPVIIGSSALGSITNAAVVVGNEADLDSSNNFVTQSATISLETDLAVTQTQSPTFLRAGDNLTYQLTVTNQGPSDATGVTLVNRLPQGVEFISVQPGFPDCNESDGVVSCSLGNLASGESVSARILAGVPAPMSGTVVNSASVIANEADPELINNRTEMGASINREADLALDNKLTPDLATGVNQLAYTITVTNIGPSDSTGVVVTDRLAEGVTLVSFGGSPVECTETNNNVTCKLDHLAPGETKSITLVTAFATEGVVSNTATVEANEVDRFIFNNTSTATAQVHLNAAKSPASQAPSEPVPTELLPLPTPKFSGDSSLWLLILIGVSIGAGLVTMFFYYNWYPFGARRRRRRDIIP